MDRLWDVPNASKYAATIDYSGKSVAAIMGSVLYKLTEKISQRSIRGSFAASGDLNAPHNILKSTVYPTSYAFARLCLSFVVVV